MLYIALLFLLSGAAGLTFELLWTHQLALVLGCTVTSVALVSGFFLLGLGLGARLGSRLSRAPNLLGVFAALELGVALSGLAVAAGLPHAARFVAVLWSGLGGSAEALVLARILFCAATLLLPCLCMGASLPVLCAYLNERLGERFLRSLSWLYAINTVGAVGGVLLCDEWLIPTVGLWKTAQTAASLDLLVAFSAALLSRLPSQRRPEPQPEVGSSPFSPRALYFACWGLGVAGAWQQIVWTRVLIVFQGSDQRAFSGVLATYLACLAGGALLAPLFSARGWSLARVIGMAGLTSLGSLLSLPWIHQVSNPWLANVLTIAPTGLCLGLSFPWLTEETKKSGAGAAQVVARALLLNTLGSLVGALGTALFLIPQVGLQWTYGLASLWLALLALVLSLRTWPALLLCTLVVLKMPDGYLFRLFFPEENRQLIFAGDDSYGSVALVREKDDLEQPVLQLLVDGFNMMSNDLPTRRYATALAAFPCLWQQHPKRVLVICMGLCHSLNTALRDPATEEVHCVELSPKVIQALSRIPQGQEALSNPKLKLIVGDGRQHLVSTSSRYQVITAEPPPPRRAGAVNLYTRDFYQLCKARLEPDGMVVQWMPIFQMSDRQTRVILKAFLDVFPDSYLVEGCGAQLCLIGCQAPLHLNYEYLKKRVASHPGLAATGWDRPEFFLGAVLAGPKALAKYVVDTPPLTDDWPILQYSRDPEDPDLVGLLFSDNESEIQVEYTDPADRAKVQTAQSSLRSLLHCQTQSWLTPAQRSRIQPIGFLEREVRLRLLFRTYPNNPYFLEGTHSSDEAARVLQRRLDSKPSDPELLWLQASLFFRRGRSGEALASLGKLGAQATPPALALEIAILLETGQMQLAAQKVSAAGTRLDPLDVAFLKRWMKT
mgnify:CR=1 FL=1